MSFGLDLMVESLYYLNILQAGHGKFTYIKHLLTAHVPFFAVSQILFKWFLR